MRVSKKALALVMSVVTVLSLMVGTLAYFTDRFDASATATAGTLVLDLTDIETTNGTNLKPGYGAAFSFTLSNDGNKSADVLETIVVTVMKGQNAMNLNASAPEFSIYPASAVQMDGNNVVTSITGSALGTVSGNKITYAVPQFTLNGGTGTASDEKEAGVSVSSKESEYVLVFNTNAGNDFQGLTLTLDYEAQAKQHRNTQADNAGAWTKVKSETVNFAGSSIKAVPEA